MSDLRDTINSAKRIVVKVGTSTLTYESGKVNFERIDILTKVLSKMADQGKEIVLVTSGAIGVGVAKLKLDERPRTVEEKQATAAVGQCELMHIYSQYFEKYGHIVGQILLTNDVVGNDYSKRNVVNTFETLLQKGIIPIVNENDSVSVDEIGDDDKKIFGENDTLSAIVSKLIKADLLIILSDIDGFYDSDPRKNSQAKMIETVYEITPEIEKCAGGVGTKRGTGGMATKLSAAKIATESGVNMVLASGNSPEIIAEIISGKEIGTLFLAKK